MSKFLNKEYSTLEVYTPGEQPQGRKFIKLNTNESPYPPSKGVIDAINSAEIENLRLYSDPDCLELRKAIAKNYGIREGNIYLSNGSDDILNFAFMAFCTEKREAVFADITYGFYKVFANLHGINAEIIPLKDDFSIDYHDYLNKNKLIFIANPNAPTGRALPLCEIEEIVKSNSKNIVVIDEAYVDFGGQSAYHLTEKYNNLLVVQTYSKSRSMAGARLGFAIANEEIIGDLNRIKFSTNPYNVNRLTLIAGRAAMEEAEYYEQNCEKIIATRESTIAELIKLGFSIIPSKANFIFAKCENISGSELYQKLKERGILVRHFDNEKIADYNRITIGNDNEMDCLIKNIKEILEEKK